MNVFQGIYTNRKLTKESTRHSYGYLEDMVMNEKFSVDSGPSC